MSGRSLRFCVAKFRFVTKMETVYIKYMIIDNYIPLFRVNQWLELKSIQKASTGREYAKKLVTYLNWLDGYDVSFENATNHHVRQFLHYLVFGDMINEKLLSAEASVSSSTLQMYITVITGFYRWLDEISQTDMFWKSKRIGANKSFLYGQIYNYEYRYLVDGYA